MIVLNLLDVLTHIYLINLNLTGWLFSSEFNMYFYFTSRDSELKIGNKKVINFF